MKIERYIVEIEMPDGDMASSTWVCDVLQTDSDIEDEGRWKVSVKEYWKPSDNQIEALRKAEATIGVNHVVLAGLISDLEKLKD